MKVLSTDFDEIYDDIIETIGVDNFTVIYKAGMPSIFIQQIKEIKI